MRIQDHFKAIPAPLQRQILRRGLMGCTFFLLSLIFLLLGYDVVLVLPGFGFMLFCMGSAMRLFYIADGNRYVIVEGICTEVTKSMLFQRAKAVTLEAGGKTLRVQLKQYKRSCKAGTSLHLYIQENTKVYERDGALFLYDYVLMEQNLPSIIDEPGAP